MGAHASCNYDMHVPTALFIIDKTYVSTACPFHINMHSHVADRDDPLPNYSVYSLVMVVARTGIFSNSHDHLQT